MESFSETQIIKLNPGRERSVFLRHPWIFSGAIQYLPTGLIPGQTVKVVSSDGKQLGWGSISPQSQIQVRMWSFDPEQKINKELVYQRIKASILRREELRKKTNTNSFRLIHSESDELPGVILDLYGDIAVLQLLTTGAWFWRDTIIESILEFVKPASLFEKSEGDVLKLEGLTPRIEIVSGQIPPEGIVITENEISYQLDVLESQKTGFYLDQRDNRELVRNYASGKKVLDCFCFTGGFSLNCIHAGAESVLAVDSSAGALTALQTNCMLNKVEKDRIVPVEANAFEYLRKLRDQAETFDLIILDPPKFAPTRAQAERASRAYKDINLLALKLLKPGGILFSFSCSGGVNTELFKKIIADAALDSGKPLQFLNTLHQASDHPVLSSFPEGEYLKGIVGQVLG